MVRPVRLPHASVVVGGERGGRHCSTVSGGKSASILFPLQWQQSRSHGASPRAAQPTLEKPLDAEWRAIARMETRMRE